MAIRKKGPDPIEYSTTFPGKKNNEVVEYTKRDVSEKKPVVKRKTTTSKPTGTRRVVNKKPVQKKKEETIRIQKQSSKGMTIPGKIVNPSPPKKKVVPPSTPPGGPPKKHMQESKIKRIKAPKKSYSGKKAKCA